jgi:hypothetical protein
MLALAAYDTSVLVIDSTHKAMLYEIAESDAHSAPRAHALLAMLDTAVFEYIIEKIPYYSYKKDNEEQMPEENVIKAREEKISFNLYPNPNNGSMTLEYSIWEEEGIFQLFDVSGKLITTKSLLKGNHAVSIQERNLSNGVYLFGIKNNSDNLFNGRVIIIK